MPLSMQQLVINIDNKINQSLEQGYDEKLFLTSIIKMKEDIKKVISASTKEELDAYCQQYNGFFCVMKLFEKMAAGIAGGSVHKQ